MIIWRDTAVRIRHKCWHIHKRYGTSHKDFCNDYGDLPVCVVNDDGTAFAVVNPRGRAYAARKRMMYRKGYNRAKVKRS